MRRIAYLSNIFVRIEDFFVACFGLWIDSFCFLAVRPMEATKNSTPSSLSSLYSLRYLTLYPDNMKYGPAFNCPSGSYSVTSLNTLCNTSQLCQSVITICMTAIYGNMMEGTRQTSDESTGQIQSKTIVCGVFLRGRSQRR